MAPVFVAGQFPDGFEAILLKWSLFLRHRDTARSIGTPWGLIIFPGSRHQHLAIPPPKKKITSILKRAFTSVNYIQKKK